MFQAQAQKGVGGNKELVQNKPEVAYLALVLAARPH
jgi:hypothetical protein